MLKRRPTRHIFLREHLNAPKTQRRKRRQKKQLQKNSNFEDTTFVGIKPNKI